MTGSWTTFELSCSCDYFQLVFPKRPKLEGVWTKTNEMSFGRNVYKGPGNTTLAFSVTKDWIMWLLGNMDSLPPSKSPDMYLGFKEYRPKFYYCPYDYPYGWMYVKEGEDRGTLDPQAKAYCVEGPATGEPAFSTTKSMGGCVPCKTVMEGPQELQGEYNLQGTRDARCGDGCVYEHAGKSYCFDDGGYDVRLGCN